MTRYLIKWGVIVLVSLFAWSAVKGAFLRVFWWMFP